MAGQFQQPEHGRLDVREAQFAARTVNHPLRGQERGKPAAIAEGQRFGINDHMLELKCPEHDQCPAENVDVGEVKFAR